MNKFSLEPLGFLKWLVMSLILVLLWQTFSIQVLNQKVYQTRTKNMVTHSKNVYAERGQILDRNGIVLADNFRDTANKNLEYSRLFLHGSLASQIVGKLDFNGHGNMGVEKTFDARLSGSEGFRVSVRDALRREVYGRTEDVAVAEPGKNLVLTIDSRLQEIVEKALKDGVEEFNAVSASAVVVDPYTGDILSMASYPTFDPNSKNQGVGRMAKNEIVALSYEPGSTFKVITAAAALENNVVDHKKVFPDEGRCWEWSTKSKPICDSHPIGDMNMTDAMVQSSNVVFGKIAAEVGAERLYRMARNFGFGIRTSENFIGESQGSIKQPYELSMDDRTLKTMGYGHSIMVTPIQMVMAYAAIANGGLLMEPKIVKEWRDAEGNLVEKEEPVEVRRVISEKTAAKIRNMLNDVVYGGTVKSVTNTKYKGTAKIVASSKIPDVIVGGKTGTAEKFNKQTQSYDYNSQFASFIGLTPIEDTRYVCLVLVDDPQVSHVGGLTAGPIFRRIMEGFYYNPELSPKSYKLAQVDLNKSCDVNFMGMTSANAKKIAGENNCAVTLSGTGNRVISQKINTENGRLVLTMGNTVTSKMPNLKGLSLKDALEVLGNVRVSVEFDGKGRVVAQSPNADEDLRKGTICKLTLKEKS